MTLSQTAHDYLAEGFNPLPLRNNKAPMLSVGHTYLYEPVKDEDIDRLFSRAEKIGIACGDVSGGFECLDFDGKGGKPIGEIFAKFMADQYVQNIVSMNNLPVAQTPSGGFHIYYRHPELKQPSHHLATWSDGTVMIETRAHGSYVATIPSNGYKQLSGSSLVEVSRIDRDERDKLLSVAASLTELVVTKTLRTVGGKWPEKFDTDTAWGRYNEEELDEMKQILTDNGWVFVRKRNDDVEYWLRPGKEPDEEGWSATIGQCHNMFYCFTDSVAGFIKKTAYTPLDILIHYKFNGDKVAAIQSLEQRYGIRHYKPPEVIVPPEPPPADGTVQFPIEVFPDPLPQFITCLNQGLNYSKDYMSIAIMFCIATLNGNTVKLRVQEEWIAQTIFWFAAVGEPGTKKSHPIRSMLDPIKKIDRESKKNYDYEYDQYEMEMAATKNKAQMHKPCFKQILINDITLESLHEVHSYNKRGLGLYRDELAGFLNDMNRYRQGSDEQFWLESFNNGSYTVNRVSKRPVTIDDTNINIIGTIQPDVFSSIAKNRSDNGLVDRFLYTISERAIYPMSFATVDPAWMKWWNESITIINNNLKYIDRDDCITIPLEQSAVAKMIEVDVKICAMQSSDDITNALKNYLNKYKTYIPRFSLLMAIFDYMFIPDTPLEVTADHVERADKIMQYFYESAKTIFSDAEKSTEIQEVMNMKKGMTKPEHIIHLHSKGFKNVDIAKKVNVSKAYVGKIINAQAKT